MYQSIEMFENLPQSDCDRMESRSMSLSEDSPARTLVVQVSELVSMIQTGKLPAPVCGVSMPESLAKLSLAGSWLKMFGDSCQSLLWEQQGEDSELFSGTWPTWGTVLVGVVMALPMLERRTEGTGCLLWQGEWRTPTAAESHNQNYSQQIYLQNQVQNWPTPRSREGNAGSAGSAGSVHNANHGYLDGVVQESKMWPTATTRDYKGGRKPETLELAGRNATNSLNDAVNSTIKSTGQLNADWVEILQGYAIGHTDIDCDEPTEWPGWPAGLGWRTPQSHNGAQGPKSKEHYEKCLQTGESMITITDQARHEQTGQYPYEPPRVITGQKNRAKRLKCLGNAVVPQQAYPIFKAIMEVQY